MFEFNFEEKCIIYFNPTLKHFYRFFHSIYKDYEMIEGLDALPHVKSYHVKQRIERSVVISVPTFV